MREVEFIGCVTAGVTHDLLNVLATIQQSAGLIEDLLVLARKEKVKSLWRRGEFPYHDRLVQMLRQIDQQLARGVALTEDLNRFAHCHEDTCGRGTELRALSGGLLALTERWARRKRTRFELGGGPAVAAAINGLTASMALHAAMGALLENLDGARVEVATALEGDRAVVVFTPDGPGEAAGAAVSAAVAEAGRLLGEADAGAGALEVRFAARLEGLAGLAVSFPAAPKAC